MSVENLLAKLHPLERKTLPHLQDKISFTELLSLTKLSEIELMRAVQWLENKGIITIHTDELQLILLDKNGQIYREQGLPEKRFLVALSKVKSATLTEILTAATLEPAEANICIGTLKQKAAIIFTPDKVLRITEYGTRMLDKPSLEERFLEKKFPLKVAELQPEEKFAFENLKKRKSIIKIDTEKERTILLTDLGRKVLSEKGSSTEYIDAVTPELLKSGKWKGKKFRHYDISINVPKIYGTKRHFVAQAIQHIRKIWLELGFKEMEGQMVQTSFWDLDALFVPQDHPARAMQDTFYLKNPKYGKLPVELMKKIKATHENGGATGSKGWQAHWSESIAKENLLRTHTTVLSAQTIAKLKKSDLPAKFFSVNKVFRNETLTWKHLFEFYQVEGIVVDPNANLGHLKGYLREFYAKMGFKDVRMRPAHFPYTEPSMEIDVLHPIKNEWVELGGAGIFRPEVVKPLLGLDIPVLAWGQGMERSIMDFYKLTDIRDLYKNDLKQIKEMKMWM